MNDAAKQRMLDNVAFIRRRVKTLYFRLDGDDHDGTLEVHFDPKRHRRDYWTNWRINENND